MYQNRHVWIFPNKAHQNFVVPNKSAPHCRLAIMAASEALTAVRSAKQELRKTIRQALTAMTDQQRKEESEKLVRKVQNYEPIHVRQVKCNSRGSRSFSLQLLSSEEYQSSKRVSVYLSMPMEVQTEGVLRV